METAIIIFTITYLGIIFTRLPWVNVDRPSAAFLGAVAMVIFGVITPSEALSSIDFNTIALLLGMMIIVAVIQHDGLFNTFVATAMKASKNQHRLLTITIFVTGLASAFMVNDVVVLLFTPVVISICVKSELNPIPFLIAVILSSNVGSAMTITGNPQNMLIGINSGIGYGRFLLFLAPVSILGMLTIIPIIRWLYPSVFRTKKDIAQQIKHIQNHKQKIRYSGIIFLIVIVAFFIGKTIHLSIPIIALAGASLTLLLGKAKPSHIIKEIDWVLLLFFAGLFVVVHGLESSGAITGLISNSPLKTNFCGVVSIHGLSLFASQIVSNVPFTIVALPFLQQANSEILWLTLASAATLAGNATILGAVANLIVIESAAKQKIHIKFFEFFKAGIIVTLITFAISLSTIFIWMYFGIATR